MAPRELCPGRPALGPEGIVDDLNYELASQRSFDVSWNVVYQEKPSVCGYLVRDLNPAPYAGTIGEVQHRYAVVGRAEAITP